MNLFSKLADNTSNKSVSNVMRNRRHQLFESLVDSVFKSDNKVSILDIGGTTSYWDKMNWKRSNCQITLLNLDVVETSNENFISVKGDATNLNQYKNEQFDIVFSNSVIEHLYTWQNQIAMASEVQRVAKYHFVQTPNYWFPIEPHWFFPFFQYFPKSMRVQMTHKLNLGHIGQIKDFKAAKDQVEEVRLLTIKEMIHLFPNSKIWLEKWKGLNKSIVAHNFIKVQH